MVEVVGSSPIFPTTIKQNLMKVLLFCFIHNYLGDDIILRLIIKGTKFYYNTKLSRQQIMDYSSEMFRKTIKHAYRESRFYHKYYRDNGIKYRDLDNIPIEEIPMISKDQVRENFYDIATKPINPKRVERAVESSKLVARVGRDFLVHTSGSTGTPCNFLYDRKAVTAIESNFIRLSIGGKNPVGWSDLPVKSVYIAPVGNGYACTALALNGLKSYHARGYVLDASKPLSEWKNVLSKYSPNYLSGYPSCLSMIAPMQEKGEINFHPKKIITGGEPITHESAVYFSKLFNSDIIDYYGCTESILLGAGGSSHEGLYLFDDLNYFEVDSNNRLVITPLYNRLFPLIRYQLNDMVEDFSNDYEGPLPFTHINRVMGRNEEIMWFTNETGKKDFLHPLFIDDLNVKGISKYQFEQTDDESFTLRCLKMNYASSGTKDDIKKQVDKFLAKKKLSNVNYEIEFVDKIPVNPDTGKIKLVIKNKKS
jgi:phenylacetate-CoA ligase